MAHVDSHHLLQPRVLHHLLGQARYRGIHLDAMHLATRENRGAEAKGREAHVATHLEVG